MKLLTKEQQELQKVTENYYICKKNYNKYVTDKKMVKLQIIVITQGNIEVLRIAYVI